jgi:serine/threonine-protein kinase
MTPKGWKRLKWSGVALVWVVGTGAGMAVVFVLSFYLAMKMEMQSTEVKVPDLSGLTREDAVKTTVPLGLAVEVVDQRHDPAVASGRVLQQEPRPGSSVRRGRRVKLVLSLGGKILTVPELVGHPSRTLDIELTRDGFAPGYEAHVPSGEFPTGTVIAQVPPAGSSSVPGERVHRLVSSGPPEQVWLMPDLTGRQRREVERWLRESGFRIGPVRQVSRTGRPAGTVVAQLPPAGYPIRSREVVQVSVAR